MTICGESAGAWSVEALLCSKKAEGLFQKAIAQSGCLRSTVVPDGDQALTKMAKDHFKVESNEDLKQAIKNATIEEIVKMEESLMMMGGGFNGM